MSAGGRSHVRRGTISRAPGCDLVRAGGEIAEPGGDVVDTGGRCQERRESMWEGLGASGGLGAVESYFSR